MIDARALIAEGLMGWDGRVIAHPAHEDWQDVWWRADYWFAGKWWREFPNGHLELTPFPVERYTPKGVWLTVNDRSLFVLGDARKQFAVPTVKLALRDLMYRLRFRLDRARLEVERTEEMMLHIAAAMEEQHGCTVEDCAG